MQNNCSIVANDLFIWRKGKKKKETVCVTYRMKREEEERNSVCDVVGEKGGGRKKQCV
jgi:hypothetical protein